jgi:two-component system chemotaxis response regulator CheY
MKFLVVDDSAVDRHLMISLLEQLGHQAEACQDTKGVLEKVATGNYAAIVLDVVMPEQDGYKFLREIRSHSATAKQHVILYSSKKTPVEINYGIQRAGANDYLTKPATKETLQQVLQKL